MKKLIFLSVLLFSAPLWAKEPSLSDVLEWKYGLVARTCQQDTGDLSTEPKMVICGWKSGQTQPDEKQLEKDMSEYKTFLADKEVEETESQAALMDKLKLTKEDVQVLKELLREK